MQKKAGPKSDIVLALLVVAIAAMLLIPLPTIILDFLLVLNISFSIILLLVGLYMPNALALSAFPALLLLTTLFRLGLNVASTRLILSQGDAGEVIEAFGTFLLRGEVVVGVIIFTIITIVNFIVIARGSSRVSEVAARFALDALPGKQLAIDSDLRSGLITAEEAQRKRNELRQESQLYGSMDGAMRFVQGDAIAGFFIIVTNILGGMYLGVSSGMSFSEAVQTYTTLTVGDGLVSQIPAILISTCAGIVVTRVSSEERSTLGADVGKQLFASPGILLFSGVLLSFLGLIAGLPPLPFISVGLLCIFGALYLERKQRKESSATDLPALPGGIQSSLPAGSNFISEDDQDSFVEIRLDKQVLYPVYAANAEVYRSWWASLGEDYYRETGMRLTPLRVLADDTLAASSYELLVRGSVVDSGRTLLDASVVEVHPRSASLVGIEVIKEESHPLSGDRVVWARHNRSFQEVVNAADIRTFDFFHFIGLKLAVFFQRNPSELLSLAEVYERLQALEKKHPGLVTEALSASFISVSRLTTVLHELIREGISIRDFQQIIERVASYCAAKGISLADEEDFDLQDMVAYIRRSRRRAILARLTTSRNTLKVMTLSDPLEELLEEIPGDQGDVPLALEPEVFDRMLKGFESAFNPLNRFGLLPVAVLCRSEIRPQLTTFLRNSNRRVGIITFDELDPLVPLEPVGEWELA